MPKPKLEVPENMSSIYGNVQGLLLLSVIKELHRIGILSSNEGLHMTNDFLNFCKTTEVPEKEYKDVCVGLGCIFDDDIRRKTLAHIATQSKKESSQR